MLYSFWCRGSLADVPDVGKVLVGLQVSEEQSLALDQFLQELGYPFVEETDNEAYKMFLRA